MIDRSDPWPRPRACSSPATCVCCTGWRSRILRACTYIDVAPRHTPEGIQQCGLNIVEKSKMIGSRAMIGRGGKCPVFTVHTGAPTTYPESRTFIEVEFPIPLAMIPTSHLILSAEMGRMYYLSTKRSCYEMASCYAPGARRVRVKYAARAQGTEEQHWNLDRS